MRCAWVYLYSQRMPKTPPRRNRPPSTCIYFRPADLLKVKAAASRAGLSTSAFCVRSALADAMGDKMTARLLKAPAFRGAIADVMSRPDVVRELAERLQVSSPKQLKLFGSELKRGLGLAVGKG